MSDKADSSNNIAVTLAALVAGAVAQQVVGLTWRAVRGGDPTTDEDSPLSEVLIFAVLSAATVAVARTWVSQKAKSRTTGSPQPLVD
jgi:hypothetical protein